MTREQFIEQLGNYVDTDNVRVRFYERSPYMANRYKEEYITWEAWLYNGKSKHGCLITQEDWESPARESLIDAFVH